MTPTQAMGLLILKDLPKVTPPQRIFIPAGSETRKLYELEGARAEAVKACAREWSKLLKVDEDEFWNKAVPQSLFDTLESFEHAAAVSAAEEFLKMFGWKVERPKPLED